MDVGLGWLGVAIGLAGCLATYRMASGAPGDAESAGRARMAAGFTLILTLLFWAVSMQTRTPFSPGQRMGLGFLIGGVIGALALLLAYRLSSAEMDPRRARLAAHSQAFLALFGASLTYSIFHGDPQTALIGFAVGAVMAGILGYYSLGSPSAEYAETWSVMAITIAAGIWLSVAHFDSIEQRLWWPLAILIGSTVLVASYVATELSSLGGLQQRLRGLIPPLVLIAVILGLTAIYSARIVHDWALFGVVAVGMAIAMLASWLGAKLAASENGADGLDAASGVVLLAVAFAVATFKIWSGLGIALGLLAAWPIALFLAGSGERTRALRGFLSLGLVVLLFRLFLERYRSDIGTADLRIHYTFIGALLGAIIPFTFVSTLSRMRSLAEPGARAEARIAFIGLMAALSPILLYLVWDIKVVLGLVFGLTAAVAFLLMVRLSRDESILAKCSIALLAIGSQLAAITFMGPLTQFELTRCARISVLIAIVLIAAVWLVLTAIWSARRSR